MDKALGHPTRHSGSWIEGKVEMSCNPMGGGCSGGPWVFGPGNQDYVVGLNSHSIIGTIGFMYSPYFGTHFVRNCLRVGGCHSASFSDLAMAVPMREEPGSTLKYKVTNMLSSCVLLASLASCMLVLTVGWAIRRKAGKSSIKEPLLA